MNRELVIASKKIIKDIKNIEYKSNIKGKSYNPFNAFMKTVFDTKLANNKLNAPLWNIICDNYEDIINGYEAKGNIEWDVNDIWGREYNTDTDLANALKNDADNLAYLAKTSGDTTTELKNTYYTLDEDNNYVLAKYSTLKADMDNIIYDIKNNLKLYVKYC